jgi:hypothetical protein
MPMVRFWLTVFTDTILDYILEFHPPNQSLFQENTPNLFPPSKTIIDTEEIIMYDDTLYSVIARPTDGGIEILTLDTDGLDVDIPLVNLPITITVYP